MRKAIALNLLLVSALCACTDLGALKASGLRDDRATPRDASIPTGLVLDEKGLPASGVRVRAFPAISDPASLLSDGAGLVSNSAAGLVSNSAAGLVSNSSAGLVANGAASYNLGRLAQSQGHRVQAEGVEIVTDAEGRFALTGLLASGSWNIEAIRGTDSKAIARDVSAGQSKVSLNLAPTGTIRGSVRSDVPQVTDFLGVQVFVPGTGYSALTDASGSFVIQSMPAGIFDLVALHPDLGRGLVRNVGVLPRNTTPAGPIELNALLPDVAKVSHTVVAPGMSLTIDGRDFGVSRGKTPRVTLNGTECRVLEKSDVRLVVQIPNIDGSGDLVVRVGELPSSPVPLQVAKAIRIIGVPGVSASAAATSDILAVGVPRTYEVVVEDNVRIALTGAQVLWSASGSAIKVTQGRVQGQLQGQSRLMASLGNLRSEVSVDVIPPVERLALNPDPAPELESVPLDEPPLHPGYQHFYIHAQTFLAGDSRAQNLPVIWQSLDPELVRVDASGLVEVQPAAPSGKARVRATSKADPSVHAILQIPVVRLADWNIEIE